MDQLDMRLYYYSRTRTMRVDPFRGERRWVPQIVVWRLTLHEEPSQARRWSHAHYIEKIRICDLLYAVSHILQSTTRLKTSLVRSEHRLIFRVDFYHRLYQAFTNMKYWVCDLNESKLFFFSQQPSTNFKMVIEILVIPSDKIPTQQYNDQKSKIRILNQRKKLVVQTPNGSGWDYNQTNR